MKNVVLICCILASFTVLAQRRDKANLVADNDNKPTATNQRKASAPLIDYKTATEFDLVKAIEKASPNHKVAIAQELIDRKSTKLADVFKTYIAIDEIVTIKVGVIEYESTPASELYASVAHQKEKAERRKYYERTNSKGLQKELKGMFGRDYDTKWAVAETDAMLTKLAALALMDDQISPRTLNTIFYTNNFKSKNYARVKFFAEKYPTAEILATLANFKNVSDVPLLTQYPQASYLAYSNYPHAAFFPSLQMNLENDFDKDDYQNAATAYKNAEARILLEKICREICDNYALKSERDDKLFSFYSIIEKRNCRLFDPVLKKIDGLLR